MSTVFDGLRASRIGLGLAALGRPAYINLGHADDHERRYEIAAALAEPWADVVRSGAATVDHLRSNLRTLALRLDESSREALGTLAEPAEEYWAVRASLPWR